MRVLTVGVLVLAALNAGCDVEGVVGDDEGTADSWGAESGAISVTAPIRIRSGQWWGEVARPFENQLWVDVRNAIPGQNLNTPFTFQWSCELPQFPGFIQSMQLTHTSLGLTPLGIVAQYSNPRPGQIYTATVDPSKLEAGWVEVRVRCEGHSTSGVDPGVRQFAEPAFPMQIRGGTTSRCCHAQPGSSSHNHSWYDKGIGYIYPGIVNLPQLVNGSIAGSVPIQYRTRVSGALQLNHFLVKVDDVPVHEAFGATNVDDQTYQLDTRLLTNGVHKVAVHSHGISNGFDPGKQLASQLEIFTNVSN